MKKGLDKGKFLVHYSTPCRSNDITTEQTPKNLILSLHFGSRVLGNRESRTPPGPEGSNGSDTLYVLRYLATIFF